MVGAQADGLARHRIHDEASHGRTCGTGRNDRSAPEQGRCRRCSATSSAKVLSALATRRVAPSGWWLSGLKTWLETGELLTTPGSLMYG